MPKNTYMLIGFAGILKPTTQVEINLNREYEFEYKSDLEFQEGNRLHGEYLFSIFKTMVLETMVNQGVAIETVVGPGSRFDLMSFGFQKLTQNSVVGSKLPFPPNRLITERCWP